jgi:uncharacterized membrane protein
MATRKILLAGESWVSKATHVNGFDEFSTAAYHTGAGPFLQAMDGSAFEITFLPAHQAQLDFPQSLERLQAYDAVILSDIGSNTLLLHPDTSTACRPTPNRLRLLRDYVRSGGGFLMFGGYCSFQGFRGTARYHKTPIEEILPVSCLPIDDRVETPEGFRPVVTDTDGHPILDGIDKDWPILLGFNEVAAKPDAVVLARTPADYGSLPLLALGTYGRGRTVAWTTDIGPHWLPPVFSNWPGYRKLWTQALSWAVGDLGK